MMLGALFGSRGVENAISQIPGSTSVWGEWPGDMPAGSPRRVTQTEAMQLMAVYGCVRLISDGISTLPVDVFQDLGDGSTVELQKPEWLVKPTTEQSFEEWCSQVLASLLLRGNAYVRVVRGVGGRIVGLPVLDPDHVEIQRRNGTGRLVYLIKGAEVAGLEMLHIRGMMLPGSDVGLSPLEYARQSIGLGLSAQRFGQDFFDGDGNMPGVIEAPYQMQPDTRRETAKQWRQIRRKGGRGLPGVLDMGATWKATGVTNEQAQFLATRQYTAAEIAGQVFLVDPSDLGIPVPGTSLTYSNLQDRNTRRVQVTFLPWIVRIERALSSLLTSDTFVKFNVNGLLRGALKTQFETFEIGMRSGFLTANEPRGWLDLGPMPESQDKPTARELAEMIQKIYLGVGVVLTADEAREILNSGGASLPPGFTQTEQPGAN